MPFPWKSLRDWVADEEKRGEVLRIKAPIKCGDYNNIVDIGNGVPGKQPQTEIRATVGYLHTLPGKPIGIIEHPVNNRPDIPVLLNPWPSRERTLRGIGLKNKDELCQKMQDFKGSKIPPVTVSKKEAPCKEVIIPADKLDLRKDISRCWLEFNQVLWSTCNATIIVYDAKSGTHDLGKLRTGQYEWKEADPANPYPEEWLKRYVCSTLNYSGAQRSNAGRYYVNHYKPTNKPMPVALALGLPTDMQMVASIKGTLRWPEAGDEYAAVGAFRGEPVRVVESETIPGLMVPADAEWIIEGEFLPELGDEMLPRYAKDIASGYLSGSVACPILRVNCITHRKNPWWTDTTFSSSFSLSSAPGARSHEGPHTGLQFLAGEAEAINHLRGLGFMVKDVVMIGGGREVAVVQLEVDGANKPYPHYGKQVLMALHGNPSNAIGIPTKYLIAVGPDINPYDFQDVMWALGTRTQPVSDTIVIGEGLAQWGDPDAKAGPQGRKSYGQQVMIDALIKVPERHTVFPPRAEPGEWETQAINQMRERIEKK